MYKRLILLILPILIVTGCSNEYNLTFVDDELNEEIISTIYSSDIPTLTADDIKFGLELDDPVTPFIEMDQYPFPGNEKIKYDKTVEKNGSKTTVTLKHSYTVKEYREGTVLNNCFSEGGIGEDDENYYFSIIGKFYCMYNGDVLVNFTTDKKVVSHNADSVSGNTYTWKINEENYKNVNINIQLSKGVAEAKRTRANMLLMIIGLIILLIGLIVYMKIRKNQKNNNTF